MSLKSSNNVETNLHALEITISAEEFEAAQAAAFKKQKGKIQLPGFRKGKATRKMVETYYGKEWLYEDALDALYSPAVEGAIVEAGLDVVGTKSADVKEIGAEGVLLLVEVYTKPEIEVSSYKELPATKTAVGASEEEITAKISELQERNSRMVAVEDRAVADGDITVIDFEGFVDGVAFDGGKAEEYELTIGSGSFIPGFEEQIVGHSVNDEFDVVVTFPEEYQPELASKEATFKIKLHEIKVKELPEVDDEFAQDAADCDTVDALKKQITKEIKEEKTKANDKQIETQVLDALGENVVGEIPEIMVESETENQIKDLDYKLSMQGMNFENYLGYMGMDVAAYKEQMKEASLKQVKIRLALEKVAELEAFEITDEDVEAKYAEFAELYSMEADKIKEIIAAADLKKDMATEKAVDFVKDNAKVTTSRKKKAKVEEAAE